MKRTAILLLAAALTYGCGPKGPPGTVGDDATAPASTPAMSSAERQDDSQASPEIPLQSDHLLPPLDGTSRRDASATTDRARQREAAAEPVKARQKPDSGGSITAEATVRAAGRSSDGKPCREVLIETLRPRGRAARSTMTFCRNVGLERDGANAAHAPAPSK